MVFLRAVAAAEDQDGAPKEEAPKEDQGSPKEKEESLGVLVKEHLEYCHICWARLFLM